MFNRIYISLLLAFLILPLFVVVAEEEKVAAIETSVLVVGTVVNIDMENSILNLGSKNGEVSTFTLGPEVKNYAEIKQGDLVLVEYFNAFAIILGPNTVGLTEPGIQHESENNASDGKTAEKLTRKFTTVGTVEAVDQKNCLVTLKSGEQSLVVNVSVNYDLSSMEVGEEITVTYIESYVIDIKPASKITGSVTFNTTSVAIGLGIDWGEGELTLYDGSTYSFDIEGISSLDVGVSLVKAEGKAYRVIEPEDLEGKYWAAEIGISYGNGVTALTMKNSKGVVLHLKSKQKGMKLTLAAEGIRIKNIKPIQ